MTKTKPRVWASGSMATITAADAKLLPHNVEAEEAVIGSILIDPDAITAAREVNLEPGDFYILALGQIYSAALELADRLRPAEFLVIADLLGNRQNGQGSQLDAIGGPAELTRLIQATPSSIYAGHYAAIVKRDAKRRRLIAAAGNIARLAHEGTGSLDELYDGVSAELFGAMERPEGDSHLYGTAETLMDYEVLLMQRAEDHATPGRYLIKTWLPDLDDLLGTISAGELHLITAITSVGKTMYMEQVAESNAMHSQRVVYYHLELSHAGMEDRRMARHAGIPIRTLREKGTTDEDVRAAVARASASIARWHGNIIYVHCPGWTAQRIAADIMRLRARGECDLAIVDYLNKISYPESAHKGWNEASYIGANVEALKNVAERLAVPIVLGCQVNREYKQGGTRRRPGLDDVKGSSDIEQKVNQVVILHRKGERSEGEQYGKPEELMAYVDKNTYGATGSCTLWHRLGMFRLECMRGRPDSVAAMKF